MGKNAETTAKSIRNRWLVAFLIVAALAPFGRAARNDTARSALGKRALGILFNAMNHEDSDVRVMAAEQWGPIGNPAALGVLRKSLKDSNNYVRVAAAGSLNQLGHAEGVPVVEAIVKNAPQPPSGNGPLAALEQMRYIAKNKARVVALRQLSEMAAPSSWDILRNALEDPDAQVRDAATVAAAKLGDEIQTAKLVAALDSEDTGVRIKAVEALGRAGTETAVAELKPLADDEDSGVRAAAIEALGKTKKKSALPQLERGAEDEAEFVRGKAIAALGAMGQRSAVGALRKARENASNGFIELLATAGLARLGERVDLATARAALGQKDSDARLLAVETLEAAGTDEALTTLETALENSDMRVRVRAAAALVQLLQRKKGGR